MKISTRREALEAGLKRFYTGRPCKHGHDAERFTTTGGCVKCNAARSKLFATQATVTSTARSRGQFVYPIHPDDAAALLAYAQGLDLARGRTPFVPPVETPAAGEMTPEQIQALRSRAFFDKSPTVTPADAAPRWLDGVPR